MTPATNRPIRLTYGYANEGARGLTYCGYFESITEALRAVQRRINDGWTLVHPTIESEE